MMVLMVLVVSVIVVVLLALMTPDDLSLTSCICITSGHSAASHIHQEKAAKLLYS